MNAATRLPIVANTVPCNSCGAKCCNHFPGIPEPSDLGAPDVNVLRANVRRLLDTGNWIVDHDGSESRVEHEPINWYLRPRMTYEAGRINDNIFAHPGSCALLVGNRCSIYAERPAGCRSLPARADFNCIDERGQVSRVDAWESYEEMLIEEGYREAPPERHPGGPV